MRSTTPPPLLSAIASLIDQGSLDEPGHVLIHLEGPTHPDVTFGLTSIDRDVHPFTVLAGFTAPATWQAVGVRARGRARRLEEPAGAPTPTAVTFLVNRLGEEASLLRLDGTVTEVDTPAEGTIPDLCRRVLGLATPPPPAAPGALWAAIWLDRVLERWGQPHRRRDLVSGWGQIAVLHPAVTDPTEVDLRALAEPPALVAVAAAQAAALPWAELRRHAHLVALPAGRLPPDVALWMDDGFFARWTLGAYPPVTTMAGDLAQLLGAPLGSQLMEVTAALIN